jgi:hypothetical protein
LNLENELVVSDSLFSKIKVFLWFWKMRWLFRILFSQKWKWCFEFGKWFDCFWFSSFKNECVVLNLKMILFNLILFFQQ